MSDALKDLTWTKNTYCDGECILFTTHIPDNRGRITVLDRLTGYGNGLRDIESGYQDADKNFWLASGGCDVRTVGNLSIDQAIEWIKEHANTCVPNRK